MRYIIPVLLCLVLIVTALPVNSQDGTEPETTEEALARAVVPPRDLSDLAVRLRGVTDIPPLPSEPVTIYQTGDVETFWVQNDSQGVIQISASLIYANDHLYIWQENGTQLSQSAIEQAADTFSERVYEPVREVFGSEWSPGIDGDPRLHILHTSRLGPGIAGYYYSNSQYPREAIETSNAREMFFVDVGTIGYGLEYFMGLLSHEFQHMIHWANDSNEESWLNEGLSELSVYIAGYGIGNFSQSYLDSPGTQLTYWPQSGRGRIYGGAFLFTLYMLEQYGIEAIKTLVADSANGMDSVQNTLTALNAIDPITGEPMTVENFYATWSLANYFNDTALDDGRYGYQDPGAASLRNATTTQVYSQPQVTLTDQAIEQWSTHYYELQEVEGGEAVNITFDGTDSVQLFPIEAYSGDYVFWSNRVNQGDARLTRAFDLREVESATLNFQTWYNIEDEWDYAYLLVSPDNGASWDILETNLTTDRNRHGTSYGTGYTGFSGGWVNQSVDLSTYAGKEILIRFEYVTDDATLETGFIIDDIAIPEIGYFTDFEAGAAGWQAEGWVRLQNVLSQNFVVQAVQRLNDGSITVTRLLSAGEVPSGEWNLTMESNVDSLIIVMSPMAALTDEPAQFSLQVQPASPAQ